jgi:hypothetical protein
MALWSKHVTFAAGSTAVSQTFSGAFNQVTVINRSTNDIYFTSLVSQGTSADGVPTVSGNNTYLVTGTGTPYTSVKTIGDALGGSASTGTDYVTVSLICAVTGSAYSVVAE